MSKAKKHLRLCGLNYKEFLFTFSKARSYPIGVSKDYSPILRRCYVFWMPDRAKIHVGQNSFLYLPNPKWGTFTTAQPMWIIKSAKDCKLGPLPNHMWPKGLKCYVHDGFELENCGLDLWNEYKNDYEFDDLRHEALCLDAIPKTAIISEGSIIGIEQVNDNKERNDLYD